MKILPFQSEDIPGAAGSYELATGSFFASACLDQVTVGNEHLAGTLKATHFGAAATVPKYRNQGIAAALFTGVELIR